MDVKLTLVDSTGNESDVAVRAPYGTTLTELRPPLAAAFGIDPTSQIASNSRLLSPDTPLGSTGLRDGCVLRVGSVGDHTRPITSALQLRVVAGPDCGGIFPLGRGRQVIGRAASADIVIADPDISRWHVELNIDLYSLTIRDLGSANGTLAGDLAIYDCPQPLMQGCHIRIGSSLLRVVASSEPRTAVLPDDQGRLLVCRQPHFHQARVARTVQFPDMAAPRTSTRFSWLIVVLPVLLALALTWSARSPQLLVLALLSPITALSGPIADRFSRRGDSRVRKSLSAEREQAAQQELALYLADEAEQRDRDFPDAAAIMHAVEAPDRRLWERHSGEESFLCVRLGIADQAATTKARRGSHELPPLTVRSAPAVLSLAEGPVGLAGPLALARASARWLMAQLLSLHSPAEVDVIAILDGISTDWRWLGWPAAVQHVAATASQRQHAVHELTRLSAERRGLRGAFDSGWSGPWIVLLVDPAPLVAELAGLHALLNDGPAVGITAIFVGQDSRALPSTCRSTALAVSETGAELELAAPGFPAYRAIADRVSHEWIDLFARRLAPLRDAGSDREGIPTQVSLADLLGGADVTSSTIACRWATRTQSPSCPIGMSANGPFELDLVRDGPHLLVAGTTGSGKSELLRSLVIGFAASHAPSEIAFVLIDYKGGAAFADCTGLPHILGVVTDLDSQLTRRALVSLEAELRRRELAFSQARASNLDDYRLTAQAIDFPLHRLVLVIDEFATLAEELPDFLTGLLSIAQRGRSLGIHLVLATQRPAGVLSLDIKANMSLRIALRVTDPAESIDVIGNAAASTISRQCPGRAIASTADGRLSEFQTARTGCPSRRVDTITVTELDLWHNPFPSPGETAQAGLPVICDAIRSAALLGRYPIPAPPWLAPLPERITVDQIGGSPLNGFDLRFGLTDDPARQRQSPATVDLSNGGSIGFIGGARSGRSTALRTLLGLAVSQLTADELNLYLVDCSGHGFDSLSRLPHNGAVTDRDDPSAIARLLNRLVVELIRRKQVLAALGADTVRDARSLGVDLPVLLIAIDGWEGLVALSEDLDNGHSVDLVIQLLRDGAAAGFTTAITGDRGLLSARVSSMIGKKFVLAMTDRGDYSMAGLSSNVVPAALPPGRAFCVEDGLETQLALLDTDPATAKQWAHLHHNAIDKPSSSGGPLVTVRALPETITHAELLATGVRQPAPDECLLGVGGDEALPVFGELFGLASRFLVAGPARSGRSATAVLIARQAQLVGLDMLIAAPERSPLAMWAQDNGHPVLGPHVEQPALPNAGQLTDRHLLLIDDAEQFGDTPVGEQLQELLMRHPIAAVACARTDDLLMSFRGIGVQMRRHRTGLLLQPARSDGELLGVKLEPGLAAPPPGRGVLITDRTRQLAPHGLALQVAI